VGVTGHHRYFDQSAGWMEVKDLRTGDVLRGDLGDLTVMVLARQVGEQRVFNMAVETDHVYYVGDLTALVHNSCDSEELNANLGGVHGDGLAAAHLVPAGKQGALFDWMRQVLKDVGVGINSKANGFLTDLSNHAGTHTNAFYAVLTNLLRKAEGDKGAVLDALDTAKNWGLDYQI
jgi:hypothetical protein